MRKAYNPYAILRKAYNPYSELTESENKTKMIDYTNKSAVLKAVIKDGYLLQNADPSLKSDPDVVLAAITQECYALNYADKKFKSDKAFILTALDHCNGWILSYVSSKLIEDKEVVLKAIGKDPCAIYYAGDKFKKDKKLALELVKRQGSVLKYLHEFKSDKDVVKVAVENDYGDFAYKSASQELREDEEIKSLRGKKMESALAMNRRIKLKEEVKVEDDIKVEDKPKSKRKTKVVEDVKVEEVKVEEAKVEEAKVEEVKVEEVKAKRSKKKAS